MNTPDPLVTFCADPSPANAIALAIADHKGHAGTFTHGEFLDALHKAREQVAMHAELVAVARALIHADNWRALNQDSPLSALCHFAHLAEDARAVCAKLPPPSP